MKLIIIADIINVIASNKIAVCIPNVAIIPPATASPTNSEILHAVLLKDIAYS